jgi:hypothetical protein
MRSHTIPRAKTTKLPPLEISVFFLLGDTLLGDTVDRMIAAIPFSGLFRESYMPEAHFPGSPLLGSPVNRGNDSPVRKASSLIRLG